MASNLITLARNLQRRRSRSRKNLTLAEGVRLVEEAVDAGVTFRGVICDKVLGGSRRGGELLARLAAHAVPIEEVTDRILRQVADTESPQGVVAIIEHPRSVLSAIAPKRGSAVLIIDGVQDPGNLGTLLRTAFALGSSGAILLKGTADPANPKALRAAAGASFRLPTAAATDDALSAWLRENDVTLWVAESDGTPLSRAAPPGKLALVVGNEGAGVRPAVAALARKRVAIPLARGAESLNVAVATGIILYEVQRVT
jgi:TrmH family RNA methyltransferase